MNHWLPWLNSRGETASSRKHAHGARMKQASSSQNSGMPSRAPTRPKARKGAPWGTLPDPGGQPIPGPGGDQRTMLSSNQVLMVPSCGPQVYGLIDWVEVLASDGSAASGVTPWITG